jgi:hypothetical protein
MYGGNAYYLLAMFTTESEMSRKLYLSTVSTLRKVWMEPHEQVRQDNEGKTCFCLKPNIRPPTQVHNKKIKLTTKHLHIFRHTVKENNFTEWVKDKE